MCSCGDISDPVRQSVLANSALSADHTVFPSTCFGRHDIAPCVETLAGDAEVEGDRAVAISRVIEKAQAQDSILIVGIDYAYYRKTSCGSTYLEDKRVVAEQLEKKVKVNGEYYAHEC